MRTVYIGASFLLKERPQPADPNNPGTAVLSREYEGPDGGVATLSWDDTDGGGIYTTGDRFTIAFDDYTEGTTMLDGVMTLDCDIQGQITSNGAWVVHGAVNMLGLDLTVGAQTTTLGQTFEFLLESRISVQLFELDLTEDVAIGEFVVQSGASYLRYSGGVQVRYALNGAVFSPALEGVVRFDMPEFVIGDPFSPNPYIGTWNVLGAEGSRIEVEPFCIIPLPFFCTQLDLRVDEDGDETFDAQLQTSWTELLPQ